MTGGDLRMLLQFPPCRPCIDFRSEQHYRAVEKVRPVRLAAWTERFFLPEKSARGRGGGKEGGADKGEYGSWKNAHDTNQIEMKKPEESIQN